jgi:hypothetical protein
MRNQLLTDGEIFHIIFLENTIEYNFSFFIDVLMYLKALSHLH